MPRKTKAKKIAPIEPVMKEKTEETLAPAPLSEVQVEPMKSVEKNKKMINVKKIRKPNAWLIHTKKVQAKNPGISYREVLKLAKTSYKKPAPKK